MLDLRVSAPTIENTLRDVILYALGARLTAVADAPTLRAVPTQSGGSSMMDDDKLISVLSSPVRSYRWSTVSLAVDDGVNVVQPADVPLGAQGRWLLWTSAVYFSRAVNGNSATLDQLSSSGPLMRVILVDKHHDVDEQMALLGGVVPAVIVEPKGDRPVEMTTNAGYRYGTAYTYEVHVIAENLRDRREALAGSVVPSDVDPGAHAIDGLLRALLQGANIYPALPDALLVVRPGRSDVWTADLAERRVVKSRIYDVIVSEELDNAPNETVPAVDVVAQAHLVAGAPPPPTTTTLNQPGPAYDPGNVLTGGILVAYPVPGLTQPITAGTALIAGATVTYAGASVTFAAWCDTYRDLNPNGTLTLIAVPNDAPQPAVTSGALRIGVTRTSGSGVVADAILAATQQAFGPPVDILV